jgi:hypothetical protein
VIMTHPSFASEGDFRVGSVIRGSASMLSRRFLTFLIVTVIAYIPYWAMLLLARTRITPEPTALAQALSGLAWAVLLIVLATLGEAVIVHAAFQDMRSQSVSPAEAVNVVLRRFFPIAGLALVAQLPIWLGLFLLIIPGLILYTVWFVGLPVCVVERLGPWTSLRRSWELTRGHRWKLFGLAFLIVIPSLGIEFGFAAASDPTVGLMGTLICTGIWAAFSAVVVAVTYRDLRVVREGVDIEQIAVVFD